MKTYWSWIQMQGQDIDNSRDSTRENATSQRLKSEEFYYETRTIYNLEKNDVEWIIEVKKMCTPIYRKLLIDSCLPTKTYFNKVSIYKQKNWLMASSYMLWSLTVGEPKRSIWRGIIITHDATVQHSYNFRFF